MDGIRILAENAIYTTEYSIGWSWLASFAVFFGVIFLIVAVFDRIKSNGELCSTALIVGLFLLTMGISKFAIGNKTEIIDHMEYKAIIEENVSFIEFHEKYEIVDQEGEIYTIIEKNQE